MAILQYKIIIFRGNYPFLPAFSIEKFEKKLAVILQFAVPPKLVGSGVEFSPYLDLQNERRFSVEDHPFSGAVLHSFCIFNRIMLQFAVPPAVEQVPRVRNRLCLRVVRHRFHCILPPIQVKISPKWTKLTQTSRESHLSSFPFYDTIEVIYNNHKPSLSGLPGNQVSDAVGIKSSGVGVATCDCGDQIQWRGGLPRVTTCGDWGLGSKQVGRGLQVCGYARRRNIPAVRRGCWRPARLYSQTQAISQRHINVISEANNLSEASDFRAGQQSLRYHLRSPEPHPPEGPVKLWWGGCFNYRSTNYRSTTGDRKQSV